MNWFELERALECRICLEQYTFPIVLLQCSHSYCGHCIKKALEFRSLCPICNHDIIIVSKVNESIESNDKSMGSLLHLAKELINITRCKQLDNHIETKPLQMNQPIVNAWNSSEKLNQHSNEIIIEKESELLKNEPSSSSVSISFYKNGDVVNVLPRTWIGINKLGGTAWITSIHDNISCDVKYVLTSHHESNVPFEYIQPIEDLSRQSRRKKSIPTTSRWIEAMDNGHEEKKGWKKRKKNYQNEIILSLTTATMKEYEIVTNFMDHFNKWIDPSKPIQMIERYDVTLTHLIVSIDPKNVMKYRTMKYMKAIMGLWIVSIQWLIDSLQQNVLLSEEKYEISRNLKASHDEAPKRARMAMQSYKANKPPLLKSLLFSEYKILLYGSFPNPGPPRSDLEYLLLKGGANVFTLLQCSCNTTSESCVMDFWMDAIHPSSLNSKQLIILFNQSVKEQFEQDLNSIIKLILPTTTTDPLFIPIGNTTTSIMDTATPTHHPVSHKLRSVPIVSFEWILDSVTNYLVQPIDQYQKFS